MLEIGTKAPAFSLPDQNGTVHTLEEYAGKKVILYFYPKDNTSGCTKQACAFEEKNGLPFTLLSDPELEAIQAYDVWKEKKTCGKVSMGVVRTTYLIDENGIIIKGFDKVKAADNPAQMLELLS